MFTEPFSEIIEGEEVAKPQGKAGKADGAIESSAAVTEGSPNEQVGKPAAESGKVSESTQPTASVPGSNKPAASPPAAASSTSHASGAQASTVLNPSAAGSNIKKDMKPKKPLFTKPGSLLPSPQKLDHLKAAVSAAGGADNLVTILQHVEDAGGYREVLESIEAYKVLKTVLEE